MVNNQLPPHCTQTINRDATGGYRSGRPGSELGERHRQWSGMMSEVWIRWVRVREGEATTILRWIQLYKVAKRMLWFRCDGD